MSAANVGEVIIGYCTAQLGPLSAIEHVAIPWRSATFDGAWHCITFKTDHGADVATLVRALPEAEMPLADGFIADAVVTDAKILADGIAITVEALTIGDA